MEMYENHSIAALIKVARIVTPCKEMNRWVVTSWGRSWYEDRKGDWKAVAPEPGDGGHHYDAEYMREMLAEQLRAYGVLSVNAIWQTH